MGPNFHHMKEDGKILVLFYVKTLEIRGSVQVNIVSFFSEEREKIKRCPEILK